jgi:hypothetical protein
VPPGYRLRFLNSLSSSPHLKNPCMLQVKQASHGCFWQSGCKTSFRSIWVRLRLLLKLISKKPRFTVFQNMSRTRQINEISFPTFFLDHLTKSCYTLHEIKHVTYKQVWPCTAPAEVDPGNVYTAQERYSALNLLNFPSVIHMFQKGPKQASSCWYTRLRKGNITML